MPREKIGNKEITNMLSQIFLNYRQISPYIRRAFIQPEELAVKKMEGIMVSNKVIPFWVIDRRETIELVTQAQSNNGEVIISRSDPLYDRLKISVPEIVGLKICGCICVNRSRDDLHLTTSDSQGRNTDTVAGGVFGLALPSLRRPQLTSFSDLDKSYSVGLVVAFAPNIVGMRGGIDETTGCFGLIENRD